MRVIKLFEEFGSIDTICRKYDITNYTINDDESIDVNGNVYISNRGLTELPIKFGKVSRDFYCNNNRLTSLEGCPTKIGGYFNCETNPVYEIWKLIDDKEYLEIFLDYDMIDGKNLYIARLNDILDIMGKKPVRSVRDITASNLKFHLSFYFLYLL